MTVELPSSNLILIPLVHRPCATNNLSPILIPSIFLPTAYAVHYLGLIPTSLPLSSGIINPIFDFRSQYSILCTNTTSGNGSIETSSLIS